MKDGMVVKMIQNTCKTCEELLLEFKEKDFKDNSSKIKFDLGEKDTRDIYNITAAFKWNGETIIGGRVEARDSEDSEVVFFKQEEDGVFRPSKGYPTYRLQDPFFTVIQEEIVIGGVEIYDDPLKPGTLAYRTIFLRGNSLDSLKRFATGPERMKDIRLLELAEDKILVFTRPQGEVGGRGTIGYTIISSLEELGVETIEKAVLFDKQFIKEEWGGANELHLLKNGLVGVLSHIAKFDEQGDRHYYSSTFAFNVETGEYTPMKLIAIRANFADGSYKRRDLLDVIFSGGLVREENGKAKLYCGVSDAEAHVITIEDPFLEYENK